MGHSQQAVVMVLSMSGTETTKRDSIRYIYQTLLHSLYLFSQNYYAQGSYQIGFFFSTQSTPQA